MPSEGLLYQGLAAYQLAWAGLSLLSNNYEFDRIGSVRQQGGQPAAGGLETKVSWPQWPLAGAGAAVARHVPACSPPSAREKHSSSSWHPDPLAAPARWQVVAPGFLGVRALPVLASRISAWDTAAALFGYFLARRLPVGGRAGGGGG